MTDETPPGWPDPVPPGPGEQPDPQPAAEPGQGTPQPFMPPGQPGPASQQPFPPPPGYSQPGAQPYGQPGYGQPGPAGSQPFPPPPGYGQPGYGQPGPAGSQPFPPPGYGQPGGQPGYGQPGYGQPGYGQPGPQPFPPPPGYGLPRYGQAGYGGWNVAPAPGGVPLRPLALGDIFNGAVTLARRNPAATFGLTAMVMTVYGVAATLLERLYTSGLAGLQSFQSGQQPTQQQLDNLGSTFVEQALPALLALVVLVLVTDAVLTGLLSAVIGRGILGHKVSLGQAWQAGRAGAVVGTTLLLLLLGIAVPVPVVAVVVVLALLHLAPVAILMGVIGGIGTVIFWVLLATRLSVALPAVVLERIPPRAAIRRSWQLSRGSFWRLFGIRWLADLVVGVASYVLTIPFLIIGLVLGGSGGLFTFSTSTSVAALIVTAVGSVVAATVTRPFSAGVTVLLYADLRMRREGLDLMLREAGQNQALTGNEFDTVWQPPTQQQAPPAAW